jgi:hypothetical protein
VYPRQLITASGADTADAIEGQRDGRTEAKKKRKIITNLLKRDYM